MHSADGFWGKSAPIGAMDLTIAAHAGSLGATLVAHNKRHFHSIPNLLLPDWE